jgi:hypothetical protein
MGEEIGVEYALPSSRLRRSSVTVQNVHILPFHNERFAVGLLLLD